MKFLVQFLGVTVAAGLGLGMGFAYRVLKAERPAPALAPASAPAGSRDVPAEGVGAARRRANPPARTPALQNTATRVHDDSPLTTQLARDLSMSTRVTRWLYWLEAIENASLPDFPRLAGLANGDATATRLVASRWVQLDLRHLFNTLAAAQDRQSLPVDELAGVLLLEWARRDPDAAVAALQGTNHLGTREAWRCNVAGYLVEKDPERGLRALSEWGMDNFAPLMSGVARWAAADPRHATEVVLAYPAGYTSQLAMETIGREWAKVDPAGAMQFASAKPGPLAMTLSGTVLKSWSGRNIEQAAEWLAQADAATRDRLSPAFVEAWAKTDPNPALAWCESNLSGSSLAQIAGSVVNGAAQRDLMAAAEFVTSMKLSPARAEAAAAVAKNWFPGWRSGKPVPAAAIAWMTGLDAASARRALEQVQWKWSNGDPGSMAEFVATAGSDVVPLSADLNVARALARQHPPDAFAWASRLPGTRSLAAGREAFAEWRQLQPESATKWLNDLSVSDPRRKAFLK